MSEKEKEELSLVLHKKLSYYCLCIAAFVGGLFKFLYKFISMLVITAAFVIASGFLAVVAYKLCIGELIIIMTEVAV